MTIDGGAGDDTLVGGADTLTVNDLTGIDLSRANIDLSTTGGGGDGQADTVIANGTGQADHVRVDSAGNDVLVSGLAAGCGGAPLAGGRQRLRFAGRRTLPEAKASSEAEEGFMADNRGVACQGPGKVEVQSIDYPSFELKDGPGVPPESAPRSCSERPS